MRFPALVLVTLIASVVPGVGAESQSRLIFSKSFPGSRPPWQEIAVLRDGAGQYKEDPNDEDPLKFQLEASESAPMFGLADKLDRFSHPLESKLKVASLGTKSFRYEAAGEDKPTEVKFNYTENPDARLLTDWFERIGETERSLIKLDTAIRFDKLGIQDAILQIEILRDQKRLVAAPQFLPLLDKVAQNQIFLNISRERATNLAAAIRATSK